MPIGLAAQAYSALTPTSAQAWSLLAVVVLLFAARVWSSSPSLTTRRILHGKTIVISGGLSPLNLSLIRSLASQGAQVIVLHPTPGSPIVQQLLHLIRSDNSNERIYAETFDPFSVTSIEAFATKWTKTHKQSPLGEDQGIEKIDTLILGDDEAVVRKHLAFGSSDGRKLYHATQWRARLALVQGLLPVLIQSKTRVINVVSPFYAASPPVRLPAMPNADTQSEAVARTAESISPEEVHVEFMEQYPWRHNQPWTFASVSSLISVAGFSYLQKSLEQARQSTATQATSSSKPAEVSSTKSSQNTASLDPAFPILSISPGISRVWMFSILTARNSVVGYCIAVALIPLIWAFGKNMSECTTEIERGVHTDFDATDDKASVGKGSRITKGSLVAGGRSVILFRSELLDPAFGEQVWKLEAAGIAQLRTKETEESRMSSVTDTA